MDDELQTPSGSSAIEAETAPVRPFYMRAVLFPNHYLWFILLGAMDIMLTRIVLAAGGREENAIASFVIDRWNLIGLVAYKFLLVVLVVLICEFVGRRRFNTGQRLARWMLILGAFPVIVGVTHVFRLAAVRHLG